jgi:hypothetical protein
MVIVSFFSLRRLMRSGHDQRKPYQAPLPASSRGESGGPGTSDGFRRGFGGPGFKNRRKKRTFAGHDVRTAHENRCSEATHHEAVPFREISSSGFSVQVKEKAGGPRRPVCIADAALHLILSS